MDTSLSLNCFAGLAQAPMISVTNPENLLFIVRSNFYKEEWSPCFYLVSSSHNTAMVLTHVVVLINHDDADSCGLQT